MLFQDAMLDEVSHTGGLHTAFMDSLQQKFVGRRGLIKQCLGALRDGKERLVVLAGKAGTGKSALMVGTPHLHMQFLRLLLWNFLEMKMPVNR